MTTIPLRTARAAGALALLGLLAACGGDDAAQAGALAPVTVPAPSSAAGTPSGSAPATSTAATASTTAGGGTVVDAGAELEVEDQSGDGAGVVVEQARLSRGQGHVVVQLRDGTVLGSAPVTAGTQPVTIRLQRPVTASGELVAVLHADDGDGAFDATRDPVVVDDDLEREAEDFDYRLS